MDTNSCISIPRTITKKSESFFSRSFTVINIKEYEIHISIVKNCEIIVFKRYSEMRLLFHKVIYK
jgi:PX domain